MIFTLPPRHSFSHFLMLPRAGAWRTLWKSHGH